MRNNPQRGPDRPTPKKTLCSPEDRRDLKELRQVLGCNDATRSLWLGARFGLPEDASSCLIPTNALLTNKSDEYLLRLLRHIKASAQTDLGTGSEFTRIRRKRQIQQHAVACAPFISRRLPGTSLGPKPEVKGDLFLHKGNVSKFVKDLSSLDERFLLDPATNLHILLDYLLFAFNELSGRVPVRSLWDIPLHSIVDPAFEFPKNHIKSVEKQYRAYLAHLPDDAHLIDRLIFSSQESLFEILARTSVLLHKLADSSKNVLSSPYRDFSDIGKRKRRQYRLYCWPMFTYALNLTRPDKTDVAFGSNMLRLVAAFHPNWVHPWHFRGKAKLRRYFTSEEISFLSSCVETTPNVRIRHSNASATTLTLKAHSAQELHRGHFSAERRLENVSSAEKSALLSSYRTYLVRRYLPDLSSFTS